MKVLVTGGLGYIGSHTSVELLKNGHEVVAVDNLYNAQAEVKDSIEKLGGKSIRFYQEDCCDPLAMQKIFDQEAVDCVIHFAGYKAVGESVTKPLMYYQNNLDSLVVVVKQMLAHQVPTIVFSSSATVYKPGSLPPLKEGMPVGASNPYGWTKVMIEQILTDVAHAHKDFTAINLRYFNPIGAHESGLIGESPNGIPNNLMPYICQVADGKLPYLHVFGDDYDTPDGTGVRDYIHVIDLARGHVAALEHLAGKAGVHTYNLGTGHGTSVLELVHAFEKVNRVPIPYQVEADRPGDLATVYADPSRAEKDLEWKAEYGIEEMCRTAWNFQQAHKA